MNAAQRKQWHIEQALRQQALPMAVAHPFDRIRLTHSALPEVDFDQIDLSAQFFGKSMASPMFVSAMTGGIDWANDINRALAEACRERSWAMGVGSQRIQLDDDRGQGFEELRHWAGDIPLFANFGAVNLLGLKNVADLRRLTDPLQADALVLHLNPMQEVFQRGGDLNWKGVARCIEAVCRDLAVPVVIKEVGFGITPAVATQLASWAWRRLTWRDAAALGLIRSKPPRIRRFNLRPRCLPTGVRIPSSVCSTCRPYPSTFGLRAGCATDWMSLNPWRWARLPVASRGAS